MDKLIELIKSKSFSAAEKLLRKEFALSPNNCYLLTQLANVLWNRCKDKEALSYADKAKEVCPVMPLLNYTRGRILWSLEKYEQSIEEWDVVLNMTIEEVAENGYGVRWAKSVINDSRYYKADCLYHLFKDKEALALMKEHLSHRGKGIESDFSKKEAVLFYKVLKYSHPRTVAKASDIGYASESQRNRILKRIDALEESNNKEKLVRYLRVICKRYSKEYYLKMQANWRGDVRPGDVVLVHGGGPIGLIVANIAKSRGATVIVSEPNESRLAMAKDFGADYSINPMKEDLDAFINKLTDGEGVNVIFEAAGVPALLAHATSQLSPAGRLVAMTFGKEPIPVNFKEINAKELTILGTRHQYQKFPEVVKILPDHLKEVDEITTHVFKAEDFQKAFDTLADRNSGAGKVVLTFA